MKALSLIWTFPQLYKDHIVIPGQFHTGMNCLYMMGHKMTGSGYSEIPMEADLVTRCPQWESLREEPLLHQDCE